MLLKTKDRCERVENGRGGAALYRRIGWKDERKSLLPEQTGNVIENKGPVL
jgi:hypothetical protein